MTLDNLMNMATADRYTEDGRQQIEDARRTYKPGEISEATGLQKQNDGTWAPPKAGAAPGSNSEDTESRSRYEGLTSLAQLSPEDLKAFRERHMANYGEGNDYRLSRNGRTAALRARSKEEARDVLRLTGWGRVALNNIEEIKRKPAGSSNWKADDFQDGVLNSPDGEYSVFQENGKWTLQSSKGSKEGYASKEEAMKAAESGIDLSKKAQTVASATKQKPSPRPKSPMVKNPDVLHMTKSGATKRIQAAGGKLLGEKDGKVWFENSDGGLYNFSLTNGKVSSSNSMSAPHSDADKAEIEKIKSSITGSSREEAYKKEGFSNLKKYNSQDEAESEMWTHIRTAEMSKDDVDAIKLYKAPDGKFKWTDDPAKQKDLEGYGYEEVQKSDYLRNQARGTDLSKVNHFNLNTARNKMNTTSEEDRWLDNFVTEMHEDGTSLDEIIKRQDEVFANSNGRYPEEEKTYKSLRNKIMKHYGETGDSAPGCNDELVYTPESINEPREKLERQLTGDTRIRVKK